MKNLRLLFSIQVLILVLILVISASCRKELIYEGREGELKGTVYLSERTLLTDHSGIQVTVDGASPEKEAITASAGKYSITGLKTGIYDIIFKKPGFSTYKVASLQFLGGNIPYYVQNVILYKLPEFSITSLKVDTGSYGQFRRPIVIITVKASEPSITYLRYFVGETSDVSYWDYLVTDLFYYNASYVPNGYQFQIQNTSVEKLPKGKQLYMVVYPCVEGNGYLDSSTGNLVYPVNTGRPSVIVPFIIPESN